MQYIPAIFLFTVLCLTAFPAYAYIGPVIAFVSYLLGPVIAIIAAIAMVLYFPIRAYMKKRKKKKTPPSRNVMPEDKDRD